MTASTRGDWELLSTLDRLITRLLDQPDTRVAQAFGFSANRKDDDLRVLHHVVAGAVDHARFGMAAIRTMATACEMVAEATRLMPQVFKDPISLENVAAIFRRHPAEQERADELRLRVISAENKDS